MVCKKCEEFPAPTLNYEEVSVDMDRQAILYRCRSCGQYIEVVALDRHPYFLSDEEVKQRYSLK